MNRDVAGDRHPQQERAAEYSAHVPCAAVEAGLFDAEDQIGFFARRGDGEIIRTDQRDSVPLKRRRIDSSTIR